MFGLSQTGSTVRHTWSVGSLQETDRGGGEGEIKPHKGSKRKNKTPLQHVSSKEKDAIPGSRLKERDAVVINTC